MIPIRLRLEGFLTFRDALEINFEELYDEGIFLISGPTGSGKTSIFDAISYALYGESPTSGRKGAKELRSHLISDDETMEIEYEFYAGEQRYLIRRWQKGLGKVINQRLVIDGDEENALTKVNDIRNEIVNVLGLSADQFTKIVMLPQGEFQNFLVASSKEKSEILRKLFNTEHYARVRFLIKEKLDAVEKQVKSCETVIDREKQISEKAGQAINPLEILSILEAEHKEAKTAQERLESELKVTGKELDHLILKVDSAEKLNRSLEKKAVLEKSLAEALKDKEKYKADEEKALQLNRIRPLTVGYRRLVSDRSELTRLEDRKTDLNDKLEKEKTKLEQATADLSENPGRQAEIFKLSERNLRIDEILRDLGSLKKLLDEQILTSTSLNELKEKLDRKEKTEEQRQELLNTASEQSKRELFLTNRLSDIKDQTLERKTQLGALRDHQEFQKKLSENLEKTSSSKEGLYKIQKQHQAKVIDVKLMREALEKQGLAQYTHLILEGAPCPLCGSDHHPTVYHLDSVLDKGEVEKAEKTLINLQGQGITLENQLGYLKEGYEEIAEKISRIEETQGKEVLTKDPEALWQLLEEGEKELQINQDELEKCKQNGLSNEKLRKALEVELAGYKGIRDEYDRKRDELSILISKIKDLKLKVRDEDGVGLQTEKHQTLATLKELGEAIKKADTESRKRNEEVTKLSTSLNATREDISERKERILKEEDSFKESLVNLELSLEEFLGLEKDLHLEETLKKAAADYFSIVQATQSELKYLSEALEGQKAQDLESLAEELRMLNKKNLEMREACNEAIRRENTFNSALKRVSQAVGELDSLKVEQETAKKLDNTTGRGTTFENYVLGYYLDGVLMNANTRLKKMTAGRFSLVRQAKDTGDRRLIEGLDINVFDTYSNTERDVKTLSGGESFKASLSMALGLSDFIQESRTGIRLDTIFIDEGFGTLDQESLDSAMETILEIQDHGRLVGIISHVEELKERIPTQIIVQNNGASGSSVRIRKII